MYCRYIHTYDTYILYQEGSVPRRKVGRQAVSSTSNCLYSHNKQQAHVTCCEINPLVIHRKCDGIDFPKAVTHPQTPNQKSQYASSVIHHPQIQSPMQSPHQYLTLPYLTYSNHNQSKITSTPKNETHDVMIISQKPPIRNS